MAAEIKPQVKLHPVKLTHDYWPEKGYIDKASGEWKENRIKAGTTIEVPVELALKLIEEKKAERADPLP